VDPDSLSFRSRLGTPFSISRFAPPPSPRLAISSSRPLPPALGAASCCPGAASSRRREGRRVLAAGRSGAGVLRCEIGGGGGGGGGEEGASVLGCSGEESARARG